MVVETKKCLFGGAMQASIPDYLVDESDFYPIPDHQEIFHDHETTKQSLIVEIVEHIDDEAMHGRSPALFYAHDLADMNQARFRLAHERGNDDISSIMPALARSVEDKMRSESSLLGVACASCQGWLDEDKVVHLMVIRIPGKGSDVLISMMTPVSEVEKSGMRSVDDVFYGEILQTFDIIDWGVFGP